MLSGGAALLVLAVLALVQPLLIVVPFALIAGWFGISLLLQAYLLHKSRKNGNVSDVPTSRNKDNVVEIPSLRCESAAKPPAREPNDAQDGPQDKP
jgi:cardiolipin synthase